MSSQSHTRVAVLDCGTNTFNLLIAEPEGHFFKVLYQGKIPVKLGKGGLRGRELLPEALQRAEAAFTEYAAKLSEFAPGRVFVSGTSAVRNARNGHLVQEACQRILGHPLHLLSGRREAELIFRGVLMSGVLHDLDNALIVDVGGGSCEFAIYYHKAPVYSESFEMGVSRLTDDFGTHDQPRPEQLSKMRAYLEEILLPLFHLARPYPVTTLVGSSGTFDTFEDMLSARGQIIRREKFWTSYTADACRVLCEDLLDATLEERLRMPGITAFRAEMLPAAAQLVLLLMEKFPITSVRTCSFALKEGILFSLFQNKQLP
ncbi:MAG: hypothetical protein N2110_02615 [Flavobacteriales bacterium]|nr:hypothetical protein [Flavobacteriales bacterium]MCX7767899.1 hypothetical protein [Flavobacteriales bacterium]MDW8409303.1 hypothetical protein [Flavobacteriales bacterium]